MIAGAMLAPPRQDVIERTFIERKAELDAAHRRRHGGLRPFLLSWVQSRLRAPQPAVMPHLEKVERGELHATWVGHSTVLLRWAGTHLLTDPVLDRYVAGVGRARAAAELRLGDLDLCLISHAHHDHLHLPSLRRLPRNTTMVVPPRCADLCADVGFGRVVELAPGETLAHRGVEVTAVPARHGGARSALDWRRRGCCGYVVRGDGPTAYFAGDTGYFSGFVEIGQRFRPDLAVLPVGSYRPLVFRLYHMSPLDAVYAFEDLGARALLPVHHATFPLSYEPLDEPAAWLRELQRSRDLGDRLWLMEAGETRRLRESLHSRSRLGK
jgi:L-ascorbate metabolism protein UlaG (beta-lactamase superfamily)